MNIRLSIDRIVLHDLPLSDDDKSRFVATLRSELAVQCAGLFPDSLRRENVKDPLYLSANAVRSLTPVSLGDAAAEAIMQGISSRNPGYRLCTDGNTPKGKHEGVKQL